MTSSFPDRLDITVPAEAWRLGELRGAIDEYASAHGADPDARDAIVLAINEACCNVVRHAYGPEGGPLHLKARVRGSFIQVLVSDNGTPVAEPTGPGAGLGMRIIEKLADDVDIEGPGPLGTKVRATFSLTGAQARQQELPDYAGLD
jgi:anti-sigma regulatory factor (Ser/Thr protein kinase)